MSKRVRGRWAAAGVMAAALGLGAGCRGGGPVQPVAAGPLDGGFRAPCSVGASLSLTASDGTGLRLVSVRSRGVVEEPLAFTELRLTFDNPEERQLEGTFSITLPPGAAVSRFAMLIDGAWQEGEVVERRAATEAYEDFLHRKQDPALLEQAAGNQFSARVFPIPARGRKELIVSYSQELRAGEPYAVPLKGLPEVEELDLQVHAPGSAEPARALRRSYAAPGGDFVLPRAAGPEAALRDGGRAVARVRPLAEARPEPLSSLLVLFDTSASRALGFGAQVATLRRLLADVAAREGAGVPVTDLCFDQDVETVFE
ncbi:MAG TPA: VIT domain-containing protein, partial [Polyangiaceae bacterium]|nr:VIT domain-containing protein [Polyangiaceae bacterium]